MYEIILLAVSRPDRTHLEESQVSTFRGNTAYVQMHRRAMSPQDTLTVDLFLHHMDFLNFLDLSLHFVFLIIPIPVVGDDESTVSFYCAASTWFEVHTVVRCNSEICTSQPHNDLQYIITNIFVPRHTVTTVFC